MWNACLSSRCSWATTLGWGLSTRTAARWCCWSVDSFLFEGHDCVDLTQAATLRGSIRRERRRKGAAGASIICSLRATTVSTSTRASTLGWCTGWSFSTRTVRWGRRSPARGHPVRELRQCRPQLGPQLLKGVHRRERSTRVLREHRGYCPGVALPEGGKIVVYRRRVKLVDHVPLAGEALLGCPLLGDASAASGRRWTPFFGRLLKVQVLDFHDHGEEHFRRHFACGARTHRCQLEGTGPASPQGRTRSTCGESRGELAQG